MTDSLTIFGDDFTGVTGIKAKGTGNGTLTYIRPTGTKSISANGTGIDVTEYAAVDVSVSGGSPSLQTVTKSYTPTESQQTETITPGTGYDGIGEVDVTVGAISSTYVGSGITSRSSTDLEASGATVTAPAGYYASSASKSVASGTEGTPTATKGTVSNHAISVTPSVTNSAGYISGGTKTGTAVSVSASELVSGTLSITSSGTKDVTNYASASVGAMTLPTSASSTSSGTSKATISRSTSDQYINIPTGYNDAAAYYKVSAVANGTAGTPTASKGTVSNHSVSVTPSVTNTTGYITGSTKTGTAVTVSASELVSGSETKTANGTYDVTNLASLVVAIPIVTYYTSSSNPTSSQGSNGDIWLVTA